MNSFENLLCHNYQYSNGEDDDGLDETVKRNLNPTHSLGENNNVTILGKHGQVMGNGSTLCTYGSHNPIPL